MLKAMVIFTVLICLSLLMTKPALACRCKTPPTRLAYQRADVVVVAKVDSVTNKADDAQVAVLSVSQAWKHDVPAQITVLAGGKVCGHFFDADQEYVLYLFVNKDGAYTTKNCVGNKFINNPKLPKSFTTSAKLDIAWLKKYGKAGKVG